jgi:hypothetical protein
MIPGDAFGEWVKCGRDIKHFAFNYCLTEKRIHNGPFIKTEVMPFPRYPYLEEMLDSLNRPGNSLDEKSRQMLWSWAAMIDSLHGITFGDHYSEKVISRKEDLVDDGGARSTTDSLFGRLRFVWENLPPVLKAPLIFNDLKIVNPLNNSFIKGESTNKKAGRGGTYSKVKCDEWAYCDNSESIYAGLHSACPGNKKLGSTPNGKGNNFARIRFMDPEASGFRMNSWHWKRHPERNQAWFIKETKGLTREEIAREYEISYSGSVEGQVYYNFDISHIIDLPFNPALPLFTSWDFGIADPTSIVWIQLNPNGEIYIIDEYEMNEEEAPHFAAIVKKRYQKYFEHIGDPAGKARGVTKKSWASWLGELGIIIKYPWGHDYGERILATRRIMPKLYVSKKCVLFQDRIANYRFKTDTDGSPIKDEPIHNWASHMMTALEFFAAYKFPVRKNTVSVA